MRKAIALFAVLLVSLALMAACDSSVKVSDGIYKVEMAEFDENGYKDFVEFEIRGGRVTSIVANAYSEKDGSLKTDSLELQRTMEAISGTYPGKFYRDLINEYIGSGGAKADVIAGATMSSVNFFSLMEVAKNAANTGDTSIRIVESD